MRVVRTAFKLLVIGLASMSPDRRLYRLFAREPHLFRSDKNCAYLLLQTADSRSQRIR
jgi:hypothetical protein